MVNIFDYTDFRKYLADCYEDKKRNNPRFSYQTIANKAGVKNKGFIYNIINGNKILSKSNIFKISRALGHKQHEADYFEYCVAFCQTEDVLERKSLFEKMSTMKNTGKGTSKAQVLRRDQYEFISNWHHVAIRSVIGMHGFNGDYKRLSKMLSPPINVTQAKHSVQLLENLGLIAKGNNGDYAITQTSLTTGKDITSVAFQNFHLACADLAKRAITVVPLTDRDMTGLTLGISKDGYAKIREEIRMFQSRIMEIADSDEKADRTYQLNFHFFPISNPDSNPSMISDERNVL